VTLRRPRECEYLGMPSPDRGDEFDSLLLLTPPWRCAWRFPGTRPWRGISRSGA